MASSPTTLETVKLVKDVSLREKLMEAYRLALGERLGELRGHRPRLLDGRGIHPYSYVWGHVDALGGSHTGISPEALRRDARAAAEETFRAEVIAEHLEGERGET